MSASCHLRNLSAEAITEWNAEAAGERALDVAWWYAVDSAPRKNVRLRFSGSRLQDSSDVPDGELEQVLPVAVVPPLVNVHTHLEFSSLRRPITPASPFTDWIRSVIRWRIEHPDANHDGIRDGITECSWHAISVIGEISTSDDAVSCLQTATSDVISFRELIGFLPERMDDQLQTMERHLQLAATSTDAGSFVPAISPHAPYSVHPDLFDAAVEKCGRGNALVAMHLAETTDELELLDSGTGRFKEFLQQMNLWDTDVLPPGGTVLRYLQQLARLPQALAVHCNYLTQEEIRFLGANPQIAVVYCPRTHQYFGHAPHPWHQIVAAGGTVVLGTDGRSSNPDLSIWKELQFLAQRYPTATSQQLLPMVTSLAAAAMGLDVREFASEGTNGTLIELPAHASSSDALLSAQSRPVATLVVSGKNLVVRQPGTVADFGPTTI